MLEPRAVGQPHVVEDQLRGDRRAQRQLLVDVLRREALRPLGDDEAADALVGRCPHDRDVGDRAVRDPHLRAVQDPVVAVAARTRAHRARVGAGVGLGQAEAADRLARSPSAAATPASAPRCPSGGSRTSRAIPAPRRGCARRCRPPRAPCRRCRTPSRSRRHSRSPRGACRTGRAGRSRRRARRGSCPPRTSRRRTASPSPRRTRAPCRGSGAPRRRGAWSRSRKSFALIARSVVHQPESSAVRAAFARRAASSAGRPQNESGVEKISQSA